MTRRLALSTPDVCSTGAATRNGGTASKGARGVMLTRNTGTSTAAVAAQKQELGAGVDVSFIRMVLAVPESVRQAAAEVLAQVPHLDALICNAAIAQTPRRRSPSMASRTSLASITSATSCCVACSSTGSRNRAAASWWWAAMATRWA